MKIGFSVRAWVLSAAAGLVIAGTMNSGKTPLAKPLAAQTKTADAESADQKLRPRHSSVTSMFSRSRRTNSQIEAESLAADSGIRQMSHEVVSADGSDSGEPRKLIERPATRDAISNSRPARNQLFPSLFQRPTKAAAQPEQQQQVATPREDDGRSAVQRRLEELYEADGRQMPDMDWDYMPEGGVEQDTPLNPQAAADEPAPIQQVSNNPFKRFFSKISPFSRKKDGNDERPEHVQKMPESLRAEQEREQQQFNAQPVAAPSVALPTAEPQLLSEESRQEAVQAIEQPSSEVPAFAPAVELPEIALPDEATVPEIGEELSNDLVGAVPQPEIPTLDDIPSVDEVLGNPFPEVSEAEADAPQSKPEPTASTPFSGLALDSEPAEVSAPSLTDLPVLSDAPALPETPALTATPAEEPLPLANAPAEDADDSKVEAPGLPELPALELPELDLTETKVADTLPAAEPQAADPLPSVPELPEVNALPEPEALPLASDSSGETQAAELPEIKPAGKAPKVDAKAKLEKIAARAELKGLKGFCPVALRDKRDLVDAVPQFKAEFEGRTYSFSSEEALKKFEANPENYAPAEAGFDVVAAHEKAEVEGTLDHAVWYKNRLFLFSSQQTLDQFSIAPSVYVEE